MKKTVGFVAIFTFLLILIGCKDEAVQKPANLIAEDKMIDILSDIVVLEAIKVENQESLTKRGIEENQYIYKKYKIDSLQFVKSNKFYASDINAYEKMYQKVADKIAKKRAETDSLIKKGINVGVPTPKKEEMFPKRVLELGRRNFKK